MGALWARFSNAIGKHTTRTTKTRQGRFMGEIGHFSPIAVVKKRGYFAETVTPHPTLRAMAETFAALFYCPVFSRSQVFYDVVDAFIFGD